MEIEDAKVTLQHFLTDHLTDPEAEEMCKAIKTILIAQKEVEFLRRPIIDMDFTEIEKALGFKLFIWQKTYITRGEWRQMGASTARSIRRLLQVDKPLKLYANVSPRERIEDQITLGICQHFHNAGIETCKVITNCY
ncbi:MAG: hypothetical protein K6E91_11040 [Butyrivibrio sp.]|nr:hypothetical protein [Butyrivibrio sp.]